MESDFEVYSIDSLKDFDSLRDEYIRLTEKMEGHTPFRSHRWLKTWWRSFERQYKVRVFCIRKKTELVCAIPIMFGEGNLAKLRIKRACFLGANWGPYDFPVCEQTENWSGVFLSWLLEQEKTMWHVVELGPVSSASNRVAQLLNSLRSRQIDHRVERMLCPHLPLSGTWNEFLAVRSKNFRRTVKRKEREASEEKGFFRRRFVNPSVEDLKDTVFEINQKSWQATKGVAVSASEEGERFYMELCHTKGEFDIDLCALYHEDRCIAYLLGLVKDGTYHAFETAYDPSYSSHSPGLLIHFYAIRNLFDQKLSEFSFGYRHLYKDRFEPSNHEFQKICIYRTKILTGVARLRGYYAAWLKNAEKKQAPPPVT